MITLELWKNSKSCKKEPNQLMRNRKLLRLPLLTTISATGRERFSDQKILCTRAELFMLISTSLRSTRSSLLSWNSLLRSGIQISVVQMEPFVSIFSKTSGPLLWLSELRWFLCKLSCAHPSPTILKMVWLPACSRMTNLYLIWQRVSGHKTMLSKFHLMIK